ncbi:hypothetical protein [Helicobacter pylori]|uniref:hypothetical protein n=1 Tax=Helicobacter pylori TaxID=210 RepID=UPI0009B522BE|nr:hypothetical protein [Helicobacter pylori]
MIGLTPTIFQTNGLITIKYDYIHYNNKILMGEIVFLKGVKNAYYKSFSDACNNGDGISKNGKRKEGFE